MKEAGEYIMTEHESDILIAEPEEETIENAQDTQEDSLFEYQQPVAPKEESKVQKKETDAFVNYKYNNLNKVYKKVDVIQTYVPQAPKTQKQPQKQTKEFEKFVTEQDSYEPEKETVLVEKVQEKPAFKLKDKAKRWLFSIISILVMLGGLAIYNGITINNMNTQITETTTSINNYNSEIKKVINSIDNLTNEDNVLDSADQLGLSEATEENKVTIELEQKNEVKDYKSQTNFFDKICNFFRHLFGG